MQRRNNRLTSLAILVFMFYSVLKINAQNPEGLDSVLPNPYICSYSEKLGIYAYGISKFSNFEIATDEIKKKPDFVPNENFNLGAGVNYKWLGLSLAFNFGFINEPDKKLKGETKSLDLQFDTYLPKYVISGNFQVYKGFYWSNPDEFYKNWNTSDSLVILPELTTINLGAHAFYVFNNERFSLKAAYQSTERQVKSAGSFVTGVKTSIYGILNDSSLLPPQLIALYPNVKDISGISVINLGGSFGYSYTYILKEYYYFNLTLMLGLNLQTAYFFDPSGDFLTDEHSISTNGTFRFAAGCNKEKYYYGISLFSDSYQIKNSENSEFTYSYGKFRIFYGRRFDLK